MKLLEIFQADYETVPKTMKYKFNNNLVVTIEDQEEAEAVK